MMLLFEIKKVLSKPLNKAALLILTAVLVIGSVLAIRDVRYVDKDGNLSTGILAARHLQDEKKSMGRVFDGGCIKRSNPGKCSD